MTTDVDPPHRKGGHTLAGLFFSAEPPSSAQVADVRSPAGDLPETDADLRVAGEYNTADPAAVAWAQRERQRAAALGLRITLEGTDRTDRVDAAWDREGWHADFTDPQTAHLDDADGATDTDGLLA